MKNIKRYRKGKGMKTYIKQNKTKEMKFILPDNIEVILLKAERDIDEGRTIDEEELFKEWEEEYGV